MPGGLGYGLYQGARSEYLALFLLSRICIVTPVGRESDVGVDLVCHTAHRVGKRLQAGLGFHVQVKSEGAVAGYGIADPKARGKPDPFAVQWLLSLELPLFLAVVSKASTRLKLYKTTELRRVEYSANSPPAGIRLVPDMPEAHGEPLMVAAENQILDVPLGSPILDLGERTISGLKESDRIASNLAEWVRLEAENLASQRSHLDVFTYPLNYSPNERPSGQTFRHWNTRPPTIQSFQQLATLLATVGEGYLAENRSSSDIAILEPAARWLVDQLGQHGQLNDLLLQFVADVSRDRTAP
jgi:hypothetical protein